jgi:hypothetical protein
LDSDLSFKALFVLLKALDLFSQLGQEPLLRLDLRRGGLIVVDLPLQLSFPVFKSSLLFVQVFFVLRELLGRPLDQDLSLVGVVEGILELEVDLVSLLVQTFKFFSGLVQFDLGSLGLSHFKFKLLSFPGNLDCQLFDLESELLDLSLISPPVLLKSQIILFLLPGC